MRSSKETLRVALHRVAQSSPGGLAEAFQHATPELFRPLVFVGLRDGHAIVAPSLPVVARAVRARRLVFVAAEVFARRFEIPLRLALAFEARVRVAPPERLRRLPRRLLRVLDGGRRLVGQRPRAARFLSELARAVCDLLFLLAALLQLVFRPLRRALSLLAELVLRPSCLAFELAARV